MPQLSYSGDLEVREDPPAQMRSLVDDLVRVDDAGGPVTVDIAQVRPIGAGWLISVSLSASGPLDQLVDIQETVARGAVDVGLEPDVPTAIEKVQIS